MIDKSTRFSHAQSWPVGFARAARAAAILLVSLPIIPEAQTSSQKVTEFTAKTFPMHYYVSLPSGWTKNRTWPVVIVIPDAYREFQRTAEEFAAARGQSPFVIVVPMVLSGGGTAQQHASDFDYTPAVWALADSVGNCRFDDDGTTAILQDTHERFNTDTRPFFTGWEAGGHVVLAQLFEHPDRVRGVVVATPNFQSRCVTSTGRALDARNVPVRVFHGADDLAWKEGQPLYSQWHRVDSVARARGFTNITDTLIPRRGHGPMPSDVLLYFAGLLPK